MYAGTRRRWSRNTGKLVSESKKIIPDISQGIIAQRKAEKKPIFFLYAFFNT